MSSYRDRRDSLKTRSFSLPSPNSEQVKGLSFTVVDKRAYPQEERDALPSTVWAEGFGADKDGLFNGRENTDKLTYQYAAGELKINAFARDPSSGFDFDITLKESRMLPVTAMAYVSAFEKTFRHIVEGRYGKQAERLTELKTADGRMINSNAMRKLMQETNAHVQTALKSGTDHESVLKSYLALLGEKASMEPVDFRKANELGDSDLDGATKISIGGQNAFVRSSSNGEAMLYEKGTWVTFEGTPEGRHRLLTAVSQKIDQEPPDFLAVSARATARQEISFLETKSKEMDGIAKSLPQGDRNVGLSSRPLKYAALQRMSNSTPAQQPAKTPPPSKPSAPSKQPGLTL